MDLNKKGIFPDNVFESEKTGGRANISFKEELNSDSLTRFDSGQPVSKNKKRKKNRNKNKTQNNEKE
jgi:hypothetical protein